MDKLRLPLEEVLRYLGHKGQEMDKNLLDKINKIREESISYFRPKYVYSSHSIIKEDKKILVNGTSLVLEGKDIYDLLEKSENIVLLAATLGNDIEKLTRRYERISMTDALILDACATTAIEEFCDKVEEKLRVENLNKGEAFTFRYSPGYGDLTLDIQKDLINILNCERRIGLTVSENKILFPRKSVTAILGVIKGEKKKKTCLNCSNYKNCIYRKEGDICGCS